MYPKILPFDVLEGGGEEEIQALFAMVDFADWRAAARCLLRLAQDGESRSLMNQFFPHLLVGLANAAGPDRVLTNLDRLAARQSDRTTFFRTLAHDPRAVEILVTLFSGSQFLTEILLRNPAYFKRLIAYRRMAAPKSADQLFAAAQEMLWRLPDPGGTLDALRRFQSWEQLRIGACDLLNLYDLPVVFRQLSNLADSLVRACLKVAAAQVNAPEDILAVLAMGKLGGRELNYSSDIDLLFLSNQDAALAQKVGERLIALLTRITDEGFLYRVDMRLRPWGKVGPLISTMGGFMTYLENHARPWEKLALLKVRPVAGNLTLGGAFIQQARPLMFGASYEQLRASVFNLKRRTEDQLRLNGRSWGEVKLGEGSIRDVEFTAQLLQLAYGSKYPEILTGNTLDALSSLASFRLISVEEARILTDGYIFLRTVEHHLQMMDYRQTHSLPQDSEAQAHLSRRLGFHGDQPGEQFLARYHQHNSSIRSIFLRYVGSIEMKLPPNPDHATPPEVHLHIDRLAPSYAERFRPEEISQHASMANQLNQDALVQVDAVPLPDDQWQVTVVAYDYPGELSLISGLLFVYGWNILSGDAFTYEPVPIEGSRLRGEGSRRKIVDVLTVAPMAGRTHEADTWVRYGEDLASFLSMLRDGGQQRMQGELAIRVATSLQQSGQLDASLAKTLYPIEIQIDNDASDQYTILQVKTLDTFGFLYEFTNALALNHVYIARVSIDSVGSLVQDTLFVTDENGRKITHPSRQRVLRTTTVLIKQFSHLLPLSPNPESALLHFGEFINELIKRPNWPDELSSLERPEVLDALARLLGVSDFLWDDFLRIQHTNLFPVVRDVDALATSKTRSQLQTELESNLHQVHDGPQIPSDQAVWIEAINAFKDREMFRIDMRHILGHTREFWDFAAELTDLTEVFVNSVFHLCHEDLRLVHGSPCLENGSPSQMVVAALGKFGGSEMGFASDIELMFIYAGNGWTTGPNVITSTEFYEKLVQYFVSAIRSRREGIFQVDLQLRPYGNAGSLSVSLEAFRRYFSPGGPAWSYERQALVRLRPVAGDTKLGQLVTRWRDDYVYTGSAFDVTAMRAMRERQIRHLVKGGAFNPKFSPGGLVDVEYLVQGLQISHGYDHLALRETNTRKAMAALAEAGILSDKDFTRLRKAHTFLRWLIDSLRVVRGNAKDVTMPQENTEEMAFLARRMKFANEPFRLHAELMRYTEDVREMNIRLLTPIS